MSANADSKSVPNTPPNTPPNTALAEIGSGGTKTDRVKSWLVYYRLPILSGLFIGTSYIPFPPWALFFCLTPLLLFWVQHATNKKQMFWAGWITQFILNLIGFHWIARLTIEFGHFPFYGGIAVLIAFAAIAHLYYPIGGVIGFAITKRFGLSRGAKLCTVMICFAFCELTFSSIFPWHLGYPWLWASFPGAQFADVIGFEGLNLVSLIANALIAYAILQYRAPVSNSRWLRPAPLVTSAVLLIALINALGLGRDKPWRQNDAEFKFLAVQGNIGNFDKYMAELRSDFGVPIVQKYLSLSRQALLDHPDANALLWPETAFPNYFDADQMSGSLQNQVRRFVVEMQTPLITGSYSHGIGRNDTYNGLFYMNASGIEPMIPYHKTILLVFGETFPFSDYIPYMDKFFPEQGSFGHGSGPTVWNLKADGRNPTEVQLGPQICYEGLYPWFSAEMARKGAQIFVNVTNDSWFGRDFEPRQHLYMTLARAIEFRRPLIRSTNTGITTGILASGDLLEKSPIGVEWSGLYHVPYQTHPGHTFYERLDRWWPWILLGSLVLVLVLGRDRALVSRRGKHRNAPERPDSP